MSAHVPWRRFVVALVPIAFGLALLAAAAEPTPPPGERLTSRPRPAAPEAKAAAVGEEVRTDATQRRGSIPSESPEDRAQDTGAVKVQQVTQPGGEPAFGLTPRPRALRRPHPQAPTRRPGHKTAQSR